MYVAGKIFLGAVCRQKYKKHQAFEAEVAAHKKALDDLEDVGNGLIDRSHYASDKIQVRYSNY
jgi:hypothetical protein